MSQPRRSVGPVIAYMLTLLGLLLSGIWLWNAVHGTLGGQGGQTAQVAQPPQTPPAGEEIDASARRQLDDILRQHSPKSQR